MTELTDSHLQEIYDWKEEGKTTAILFGRFQPLHNGHMKLIRHIQESGLDLHIFVNSKVDGVEGDKNPYSEAQRRRMFKEALPDFPQDHLHFVQNVYLGRSEGTIDVKEDMHRLIREFETQTKAIPSESVIFYARKPEDVKSYLVNQHKYDGVHYIDLLTHPECYRDFLSPHEQGYSAQQLPFESRISSRYIRGDHPDRRDMLSPLVADYVAVEGLVAERNHRKVGAGQNDDARDMDGDLSEEALAKAHIQRPDYHSGVLGRGSELRLSVPEDKIQEWAEKHGEEKLRADFPGLKR